ncbi:MAG: hypothetical protein P4L36_04455 [Holophaga sp.]|nr:hypothetical protein [Holophaga sp.]
MRPVRWLAMVGWQACLVPLLCAQDPYPPPCGGWVELIRACPDPASHGMEPGDGGRVLEAAQEPALWHPWAFALAGGDCPCLTALPGAAPAAPHWHGAKRPARGVRNLVVEVSPIELTDAFGSPRGTFR